MEGEQKVAGMRSVCLATVCAAAPQDLRTSSHGQHSREAGRKLTFVDSAERPSAYDGAEL